MLSLPTEVTDAELQRLLYIYAKHMHVLAIPPKRIWLIATKYGIFSVRRTASDQVIQVSDPANEKIRDIRNQMVKRFIRAGAICD